MDINVSYWDRKTHTFFSQGGVEMNEQVIALLRECHAFIDGGFNDFDKRMDLCDRLYKLVGR